jgi:peptide-methionine (S)-S-oxide reductase
MYLYSKNSILSALILQQWIEEKENRILNGMTALEKVAFGGGCFWCTEAVFLEIKGVCAVTPGYAGGHKENPTYEQVSTGTTGHAEVILIEYDPGVVPFSKLLEVFFASHDPTTLNRQGADVGTQYRSIILYETETQKEEAEQAIKELERKKAYQKPIVTEVVPLKKFYPAEEYHKKYYERHPNEGYSQAVIAPKVGKVREKFKELLK